VSTAGGADNFRAMNKAIALQGMRPVVDRVFAFEELHQVLRYLASGRHFGKICISHTGG